MLHLLKRISVYNQKRVNCYEKDCMVHVIGISILADGAEGL